MEKYRNFSLFIILIPTPDFPLFLLYVRWKSGVIFVRRCFRDVHIISKRLIYTFRASFAHFLTKPVVLEHVRLDTVECRGDFKAMIY